MFSVQDNILKNKKLSQNLSCCGLTLRDKVLKKNEVKSAFYFFSLHFDKDIPPKKEPGNCVKESNSFSVSVTILSIQQIDGLYVL